MSFMTSAMDLIGIKTMAGPTGQVVYAIGMVFFVTNPPIIHSRALKKAF